MNSSRLPVPDLAQSGRIIVTEKQVVFPAALDALMGGLSEGQATLHVRVIHVAKATAWLVPCDTRLARAFARQITELCDKIDAAQPRGELQHGDD